MLDAALEHAGHGVPVFQVWHAEGSRCACRALACANPAKHPIASTAPHGFKNATTDPGIIREWFTLFQRGNIAEATGHYSAVLDVDPDKGGRETLASLEAQHGPLPYTPKVLTGGGGEHYRFRPVHGLRSSSSVIGPGLDIRAEGGYALLPPSNHVSGALYRDDVMAPMYETELAEMPAWIVALANAPKSTPGSNGHASVEKWVQRLAGAPEGQRRAVALQIAGHYLGLRIAPAEVESILIGYAARCVPPFPESEARELVRDLARRHRGKESTRNCGAEGSVDDGGLGLVAVGDLLAEADDPHAWVVEKRLPVAGLCLLCGKPKSGKSTCARCLALAVARGEKWLGHATRQGPVIYLALEEKRAEVRAHFRALGTRETDPIFLLCASAPEDGLTRLARETENRHPVLIIIDPLFRFVRVPDGNDYATMTAALEPLLTLARSSGACILLVHHLGKGGQGREDGDTVLGSTAIFGAVDSALLMKRTERYRTLSSIQRYGDDLEEITVILDPDTRDVVAGPPKKEADLEDAKRLLLTFLANKPPILEAEMEGEIECRRQVWKRALRELVGTGTVVRTGQGGKAEPFRYCGSPYISGTQGTGTLFPAVSTDPHSQDSGSRAPYSVLVPQAPENRQAS